MRLAFALEDFFTQQSKLDTKFIKFYATYKQVKDGEIAEEFEIPLHTCTDEDYAEFYPVDEKSEDKLNLLRTVPGRSLLCLDWSKSLDLYGTEASGNFAFIDIMILPCNHKLTHLGALDDRIDP